MWLVWSLASAVLAAEPTVALPDGEPAELWHAPLRIAGLEVGASGERGRLRVVGAQWELCVPREPTPTCMTLDPPTTDRQREDVAWLVVSLQNELVFDLGEGAPAAAGAATTAGATAAAGAAAASAQVPSAPEPGAVTAPPPVREESVVAAVPAPISPAPTVVAASSTRPETPEPAASQGPSTPSTLPAAGSSVPPASTTNQAAKPGGSVTPPAATSTDIDSVADTDADIDAETESAFTAPPRSEPEPPPAAAVADSSSAALEAAAPQRDRPPAPAPTRRPRPGALRVDDLRLGLGARWQVSEGASPFLTGELRGPLGPLTGAVVTAVDAPITLSEDPLRRTWTATVGLAALYESGALEVGVGAGLEHQRWWQDQALVEAAFRPQVGVRGGVCPRAGWVCVSGLTGWSLRRVTERSDGATPSVATPLHFSLQVHLRRTRTELSVP